MVEKPRRDQVVVDHHVGLAKQLLPSEREQLRVSRPRPNEIYFATHHENTSHYTIHITQFVINMARPAGFEPTASSSGGWRSIR